MSTPIKILRNALFELVDGIDISAIVYTGWEFRSKYPPKERVYPGFWVEPISNVTQTLDSCTNQSTYTFGVFVTESYEDAETGEDTSIELADCVYQALLAASRSADPFGTGLETVIDGTPQGQWGFEERYGERVYQITLEIRVSEEITP